MFANTALMFLITEFILAIFMKFLELHFGQQSGIILHMRSCLLSLIFREVFGFVLKPLYHKEFKVSTFI